MVEVVRPAARRFEEGWVAAQLAKYPPRGQWVLAVLLHIIDATPQDFAAWAELRLQGRFTLWGMVDKERCPLCLQCDTSLTHLWCDCVTAAPFLEPLRSLKGGAALEVGHLDSMATFEEMETVVRVCGNLLRAVQQAVRNQ